jgi:hypothetical protein
MIAIKEDRILKFNGYFTAFCVCGKSSQYTTKDNALKMIKRGSCRNCKKDYRNINDDKIDIYKVGNKWGKKCSGCGVDQLYTRKDHAKQSSVSDWQCKKCVSSAKKFSENRPVGDKQRMYNKFSNSAKSRGIKWSLSIDEMYEVYNGYCNMTGWEISINYSKQTASLDRIDNNKGYIVGNIQWVHSMVNMCKNRYKNEDFIEMCKAIANRVKW